MLSHAAEKLGHSIVGAEGFWRLSIDMISIIFGCFAVMQYVLCCIILNDYLEISSTYIQLPRRSLLTVCRKPHPPCRGWQGGWDGWYKKSLEIWLFDWNDHAPSHCCIHVFVHSRCDSNRPIWIGTKEEGVSGGFDDSDFNKSRTNFKVGL